MERTNSRSDVGSAGCSLEVLVAALIVITDEISREEDAFEIFGTTNARGLTPHDSKIVDVSRRLHS